MKASKRNARFGSDYRHRDVVLLPACRLLLMFGIRPEAIVRIGIDAALALAVKLREHAAQHPPTTTRTEDTPCV